MALNTFIMDLLKEKDNVEMSFEKWKDETLAERKRLNTKEASYLQNHYHPRIDFEKSVAVFFEENKTLRKNFIKKKTNDSLHLWLSHYSKMPDNNNISNVYTAFS